MTNEIDELDELDELDENLSSSTQNRVSLQKSPVSIKQKFYKMLSILFFIIGFGLCITIVGIIPGFGILCLAALFYWPSRAKESFKCPNCSHENEAFNEVLNAKCPKCEQLIVIDWAA